MPQPQLVELINNWDKEHNGISPDESTLAARFEIQALRMLAKGKPVSAEELAARLDVPIDLVKTIFEKSRGVEGEWDDDGQLIGNALSLVPTKHRVKVKGKDLFAWCAFDTLLIPSLIGDDIEVESPDPITGELVKLTITPARVKKLSPSPAVLSMVLTGAEATGPESDFCSQTHFFSSRESAEQYQKEHSDVTIMNIDEAESLVQNQVLAPMKKALEEIGSTSNNS